MKNHTLNSLSKSFFKASLVCALAAAVAFSSAPRAHAAVAVFDGGVFSKVSNQLFSNIQQLFTQTKTNQEATKQTALAQATYQRAIGDGGVAAQALRGFVEYSRNAFGAFQETGTQVAEAIITRGPARLEALRVAMQRNNVGFEGENASALEKVRELEAQGIQPSADLLRLAALEDAENQSRVALDAKMGIGAKMQELLAAISQDSAEDTATVNRTLLGGVINDALRTTGEAYGDLDAVKEEGSISTDSGVIYDITAGSEAMQRIGNRAMAI